MKLRKNRMNGIRNKYSAVKHQPKITAARAWPRCNGVICPDFIWLSATWPMIAPTIGNKKESTSAAIGKELSLPNSWVRLFRLLIIAPSDSPHGNALLI